MKTRTVFIALIFSFLLSLIAYGQTQRERGLKVGASREEASSNRNVELWAVIIGLSRYENGDRNIEGYQISNLKNAADDAQAVYDFLRSNEGGGFRDVAEGGRMILLKDEQAVKDGVERALSALKQAKPDDYFVIYIAAHGALVPQRDQGSNETIDVPYFVLYDTDLRDMKNTALRMDTFKQIVAQIPARKGLVLSDTCHSAGVQLAGRDPSSTSVRANVRYINEMSKVSGGVGFISAADQLEQSYERDDLNQGVFTYSLLEGLRGNADLNEDGMVNFNELVAYLREQVPKLTDQKQHPFYNTTAIEANYIPLSVVKYADLSGEAVGGDYGMLVFRSPDLDGVEASIDDSPVVVLSGNMESSVKVKAGTRKLTFSKGAIKQNLSANVEPGKSRVVEVNLTFSESDDDALVAPTGKQANVFLREDKEPVKEAKDLFLKGVDFFNKQKFKEAADQFAKAVNSNGGAYADAFVYKGRAEQSLGLKEAAVASFRSALAVRPTDFETQTLLSEAEFNAGYNVAEVIASLRSIVTRHPNFDYARVVLGDVLLWRRDFTGAERQLRRAVLINPKSPPAHMILADALTYSDSSEKRKEAVAEAENAITLFDEVSRKKVSAAKGLKRLSISHVIFGGARYVDEAALAEAHQIAAKACARLVERDESLVESGQYLEKGRMHVNEAIRLAESSSDKRRLVLALDSSAQIRLLSGDPAHAIEDAEQALKIGQSMPDMKDIPDSHYTLYSAYAAAQKYAKAADHLQKFIAAYNGQLTPQERKAYEEELARLKRMASANRQKN